MSTIAYTRKGSGEPMLLIHGIGHQRTAWGQVVDLLAERYDVVAVDLPGFGNSPRPAKPARYSMVSYGEQILDLLRELGMTRPHVAGNSLGGLIALELAARGEVRSVTAFSPAGFYTKPELAWIGSNLLGIKFASHAPYKVVKLFADKVPLRKISMKCLYQHPEWLSAEQALDDTLNLRQSKGFWPCFVGGILHNYRGVPVVPTTIAWGDHDKLLLPRQGERAKERLPHVSHIPLPDCGHVPMLDNPRLVVEVIEQTVARADAPQHASLAG